MGFAGCKKKPSVYAPLGCGGSLSFSQLCILLVAKWQNEDRNGCESRLGGRGVCVISVHCAKSRGLWVCFQLRFNQFARSVENIIEFFPSAMFEYKIKLLPKRTSLQQLQLSVEARRTCSGNWQPKPSNDKVKTLLQAAQSLFSCQTIWKIVLAKHQWEC